MEDKKSKYPGFTEARARANKKYMERFVEVKVRMTPERRSAVQAHAEAQGESTTGFINRAIVNQIAADNGVQIGAVAAQEWQQAALPPETVEAAQRAAEATGEATQDFIRRAVDTQAQRDANALRLGINPSNGDKLDKEV